MPGEELVPSREHVGEAPVLDALGQPVGRGDLDLEARHHAEHPDRDLRRAQELGLRLVDLDDLAVAVTRRQARSVAEKLGSSLPEPCVPVATAPAMACVSMSPWLASASPAVPQRLAELAHGRARQRRDQAARGVDVRDAAQARSVSSTVPLVCDRPA